MHYGDTMSVRDFEKMSVKQLEKQLKKSERKFVKELELDGDARLAVIRAGLADGKKNKSADEIALKLLRNEKIIAYRAARQKCFEGIGDDGEEPEDVCGEGYQREPEYVSGGLFEDAGGEGGKGRGER